MHTHTHTHIHPLVKASSAIVVEWSGHVAFECHSSDAVSASISAVRCVEAELFLSPLSPLTRAHTHTGVVSDICVYGIEKSLQRGAYVVLEKF